MDLNLFVIIRKALKLLFPCSLGLVHAVVVVVGFNDYRYYG